MDNAPPTDTLIIRNMTVDMSMGIHDFEKTNTQRVIVNVEISVAVPTENRSDDITAVLSYADIVTDIESIATSGHINLVETFAERIAAVILTYPQALNARVRVEKPDIFDHIDGVGIEIIRAR